MALKILVVEDDESWVIAYMRFLKRYGQAEVITAYNLVDAMASVEANPDIDAVIVDGFFPRQPGGDPFENANPCNGEKFVLWFRRQRPDFTGEIIAGSSDQAINDRMMGLGATVSAAKGSATEPAIAKLFAPKPAS